MYSSEDWLRPREPDLADASERGEVVWFPLVDYQPLPRAPRGDIIDPSSIGFRERKSLKARDHPHLLLRSTSLLHERRRIQVSDDGSGEVDVVSPVLWGGSQHSIDLVEAGLADGDALLLIHDFSDG